MKIARHLVSFILPVTVLVIIPLLIEDDFQPGRLWIAISGGVFILSGLLLIAFTVGMFIRIGKGTLAPWDPARNLITGSLYGYVRNPMILGVTICLAGEAIFFTSLPIALWAVIFVIINTVYFMLSEEPALEKRFGAEYREYKDHVPRWIPRRKPWHPGQTE